VDGARLKHFLKTNRWKTGKDKGSERDKNKNKRGKDRFK
jgi:hypothetical protein